MNLVLISVLLGQFRHRGWRSFAAPEGHQDISMTLDLVTRQGVIHMSRRGPTEATVQVGSAVDSDLRQVWVLGAAAVNRAMHGDAVAVRLLPRWV